jgi:hypothetical protein
LDSKPESRCKDRILFKFREDKDMLKYNYRRMKINIKRYVKEIIE